MTQTQNFEAWKAQNHQSLKVYFRDGDQDRITVLCLEHRDIFFLRHPDAHGAGEYGGQCMTCNYNRRAERPRRYR